MATELCVYIITVNYNGAQDTIELIKDLEKLEYDNYEIVVVENGSTDKSKEQLQNFESEFNLIINENNKGYSAGANNGIEYALQNGAEYVFLINNDTTVPSNILDVLVDTIQLDTDAVAASSVIRFVNGGVQYAGADLNTLMSKSTFSTTISDVEPYETEALHGAAVLLDTQFLDSVGGLDEAYFFGMDDTDLSYEIQQRGKKIFVNPTIEIEHEAAAVAGMWNQFRTYHTTRNRLRFLHHRLSLPYLIAGIIYLVISRIIVLSPVIGFVEDRYAFIRSTLLAAYDYIRGNPMKGPNYF